MRPSLLLVVLVGTCFAAQRGETHEGGYAGYDLLPSHKRNTIRNEPITLTVALKQRNVDKLEGLFWVVSNPSNPAYGKYLGRSQMVDLVAPTRESTEVVLKWFTSNGIKEDDVELAGSNDFLRVHTTVGRAEEVLQAPTTAYVNKRSGRIVASFDEGYSVPESVSQHVDFISHFNPLKNALKFIPETTEKVEPRNPVSAINSNHYNSPATRSVSSSATNAPIITEIYSGTNGFQLNGWLVFCLDGSDYSTSTFLCGAEYLLSTNVVVTNNITGALIANYSFSNTQIYCYKCKNDAVCSLTSYDQEATLCFVQYAISEYRGVPNYLPFTVSVSNTWYYNSSYNTSAPYDPANDAKTDSDWYTSRILEGIEDTSPDVTSRTHSIPSGTVVTQSKSSQAVIEFGEDVLVSDATKYFQNYSLPDMTNLIKFINPQYVNQSQEGVGEGILDIVCIMGTARNCTTYYYSSNPYAVDPYYTWLIDVLNSENPPFVHSMSWGSPEIDPFQANHDYLSRSNIEFMKAGVRGLSILVSSGDAGAQWYTNSSYPAYSANYPASSPYVTTVGATSLAASSYDPSCYGDNGDYTCPLTQKVCSYAVGSLIASGGGFSDLYGRPSYQDSAVSTYLPIITQSQVDNGVNKSGRGFPDIAAIGHNYPVFYNGQVGYFDGTSAAAPVVAGMITLLNDIRFSQGKSPLGFLNPLLYSLDSSYFFDVTEGDSFCVRSGCSANGFVAAAGWDPATGLGTPNFALIAAYVSTLPDTTTTTTTTTTTVASTTSPSTIRSTTSDAATLAIGLLIIVVVVLI